MANPKPRRQIRPRQGMDALIAPLNATGGKGIGVASSRTNALGDVSGQHPVIGFTSSKDYSKWAALVPAFGEIAQAAIGILAKRQEDKSAEEKKRLADLQKQQDIIDTIHGAAMGQRLLSDVDEKTRSGDMSSRDAEAYILSHLEEHRISPAFMKAAGEYALKATEVAYTNDRVRVKEAQVTNFMGITRQGFASMYENYDPGNREDYAARRMAIYNGREALGLSEADIRGLELETIILQARKAARDNPLKSEALMALAEAEGDDGTPSLAALLPDGYAKLDRLREYIDSAVLQENKQEAAEAKRVFQETTKENYITAVMELSQLADVDAIHAWEAENIGGKSADDLKAVFGDHRAEIVNAVSRLKANPKPEGNDQALAEWSMAVQRQQAEWQDIAADNRLNDKQKAQLYGTMRDMTQKAQLGYISDAQLASKLLVDLQEAWTESVYSTPWSGSRMLEPGRPPVVTPEGIFYQSELFRRLKDVDPKLDVVENNKQKQEIAQEIKNEIISGRIRFKQHAANLDEPVPELRLSIKAKEGEPFTETELSALGKCFNDGGGAKVKEVFGVNMFELAGPEQLRIASEAQRQRAELDALRSHSLFNNPRMDEALGNYSRQIMGMPMYIDE